MKPDDQDPLRRAFGLNWDAPPDAAKRSAQNVPSEVPAPPVPEHPAAESALPSDVRAGVAPGSEQAIQSRSFPGLDVTLTLRPPAGDALWLLEGRAWRTEDRDQSFVIVLAMGDHVLGRVEAVHGDSFRFDDVLSGPWTLEFHLGPDQVVLLHGTA